MKRNLLLGWISLFGVLAFAQEDPVVMRINGKEIPRSEFEYSYRRHTDGNTASLQWRKAQSISDSPNGTHIFYCTW